MRIESCPSVRTLRIVTHVAALVWLLVFCLPQEAKSQKTMIGDKEYRQVSGKWFKYIDGERADEIIPCRLILRLKNKGEMRSSQFSALGIEDVQISSRRFSDGYYVMKVKGTQDPFAVAQSIQNSGVFDKVEFDAYGERMGTP